MNTIKSILTTARASAAARRGERRQDAVLAGELADYRSASDRLDLEAMMARYPDDQTAPLRRTLARTYA